MTSERQIAANRRNSRKSRGPRTAAGKSIASRNALRHGLAAVTYSQAASAKDIERFAKALCGDDDSPSLFEPAKVIANNELVLRAIAEQQLAVVERVREPSAVALAKGDNSLALAKARMRKSRCADDELVTLREKLLEQYKAELPPPDVEDDCDEPIPPYLWEFLVDKANAGDPQPSEAETPGRPEAQIVERDEFAAFEEAAADLVRLARYERKAWLRQKRAIAEFMQLKRMQQLSAAASTNELR